MNLIANYSVTLFQCILLIPTFLFSQSELLNKEYYKAFDSLTAHYNIEVFNGSEHVDVYLDFKKDNHKFYYSKYFLSGSVFYNGQPYHDYNMKYDLLNDFLLLEYKNEKINYLRLNEKFVDWFFLNGGRFIRLLENQELDGFYRNGFFKEAYKGNNFAVYIKLLKDKTAKFRDQKVYYAFDEDEIYILYYKNKYYRINKIKDITEILPSNKIQIQEFYKSYRKLYKQDREEFLERLFKTLENVNKVN